MTSTQVPEDLRYTDEHEWIRKVGPSTVRIGVTDFAQNALNEVVFVQLPDLEAEAAEGESFAEIESHKSVSDIYAPLAGVVSAVNDAVVDAPELVNSDPYGEGWLLEITVADDADLDALLGDLLDADGYREVITD
ncbi:MULTISPECIES: glycine cleavage system protein GcvH [unclassified Gordonia (in: high G+C Gram-positive bacteria)]|uniref:glycine cleavage system protein GcvH n=1 Tax=unclassified Gordonia (in: high G+C Gram-positive bacteria) TaxID=2657482 RepID=UPI001FFE5125|nr:MULTISPECIES: glycine cleavage system protein GcvH [unclassified Gordonia (in: high G+C Gram-positive bacteria)]UQE76683.1 glycine cleavage system protein GcvH [Gordonia sp. PP30]